MVLAGSPSLRKQKPRTGSHPLQELRGSVCRTSEGVQISAAVKVRPLMPTRWFGSWRPKRFGFVSPAPRQKMPSWHITSSLRCAESASRMHQDAAPVQDSEAEGYRAPMRTGYVDRLIDTPQAASGRQQCVEMGLRF